MLSGADELCFRRIAFEHAYIAAYGESMCRGRRLPITVIAISPMRLDFDNHSLRLDRRWPQAPDGWQKYEEEKVTYAKAETEKEDNSPVITKIYWKDAEGKEILNLPEQGVATLCAETENTHDGDSIQFDVELADGSIISVSGTVDSEGVVEIPNVNIGHEPK